MRIYTIARGVATFGATVRPFKIKNAGVTIPAILIGEEGRGRSLGVLPVQLTGEDYKKVVAGETVTITNATVGTTKAGGPKLFACSPEQDTDEGAALIVFRTECGYRGGCSHTGDRVGWFCTSRHSHPDHEDFQMSGEGECPHCKSSYYVKLRFLPWPGKNIVVGYTAQGDAGRMGGGEQLVTVMPIGSIFRTGYSGRLYGNPSSHYYYLVDKDSLVGGLTWENRCASDVF